MKTKFDFTKTEDYLSTLTSLPELKEYMYRLALNYGMRVDDETVEETREDLYSIWCVIHLLDTIKPVA